MEDNFFSLKSLLDYKGNRYELARACMEYAKRVRYVAPDEYKKVGEKEALVSLKHLLNGDIKYTSDRFEIEIYEEEANIITSQREAGRGKNAEIEDELPKDEIVSEEKLTPAEVNLKTETDSKENLKSETKKDPTPVTKEQSDSSK